MTRSTIAALFAFATLFALTTVGGARVAHAQASDDEQARTHFMAGTSYFDQARYEEAAAEFEESYRLSGRGLLLVNIARCFERLGRWDDAVSYLERYLADAGDVENRNTLEARLASYRERAAAQAPAADPVPTNEGSSAADSGPSGLFIGAMIALGVGAASAGVFLGTGLAAHGNYERLQEECGPGGTCPGSLRDVADEGALLADVSTVFTVISIAALATGAALLIVDLATADDGDAESASARLEATPLPGGGALSVRGRF